MRKTIILVLALILILSFTLISSASSDVKVVVNGEEITFPDATPYINEDSRTLVPVRFIAENLGCSVDWKDEIRQVGIEGRGKGIKLNIGENKASVDGEEIEFDTKAIIKDDRTFVPLRFVSEALGAKVEWNSDTRTVFISTEIEKAELPMIDKDKIIQELGKYSTDYTNEYKDIKIANKQTIKILGDKETTKCYKDAKKAMELLYNRNYKEIPKDYKTNLLYYLHGWRSYKEKEYAPVEFIDKWIEEIKADKIIQQAIFTTDPSLVYITENDGGIKVRGRLSIIYQSHNNIKNSNLELEKDNKINLEIGKWYEVDVDILLDCPITNAPRPEGSKHAEWVYNTIKYLSEFKEIE